jgi:hypothetical protein
MKNIFTFIFSLIFTFAYSQGIVWEDQGLVDEAEFVTGSSYTDDAGQHTVTVTWNTVTNGGSFLPCCGDNFVSYEADAQGAHAGHIGLGFNNSMDDNADKICVTLTFDPPVEGLKFTLLDVDEADDGDQTSRNQWDDAVEIFYNGTENAKNYGTLAGPCVYKDSEIFMDGFEGETFSSSPCGDDGTDSQSTDSNIDFEFGSTLISSVTVKYFSSNDIGIETDNPDVQLIGISDLEWNVTLPVELVKFSVSPYTKSINLLNWITANELNNDYFLIERSNDGARFQSIGKIRGKGNSIKNQEYEFKDYKPFIGSNYYRLKQVDQNGDFKYSAIRTLVNAGAEEIARMQVWPNPVYDGLLHVTLAQEIDQELNIYNSLSQLVKTVSVNAGEESINVSELNPGLYFLRFKNSDRNSASFVISKE